jgi:membrane protease YdiL (CAAX protease family)
VNEFFPSPETPPPEVITARPVQLSRGGWPGPAAPLALPTLSLRRAILDLSLLLFVTAVALSGPSLALGIWMVKTGQEEPREPTFTMMMVQESFQVILAIGLLIYLLRRRNLPPPAFGLQWHHPGRQVLWGAAGLGLTYGWMIVSVVVISAVLLMHPSLQSDLMKRQELLELLPDTFWRIVVLVIPVAISEEIFFRGLLLPYLRRVTGYWWLAVLLSTVVFAALHFQQGVIGILQISGVAAIFALLFVYSRSLLATIVAHFAFDVGQMLFMVLAGDMLKNHGFG